MEDILKAVLLGIVEGLTEFLPVSSTGHLIVAGDLLDFDALGGTFEIFIQIGAVLAVLWFYRDELLRQVRTVRTDPQVRRLWLAIVIASIPAAIFGFTLRSWIKEVLFSPVVVAITLILGGLAFIAIERRPRQVATTTDHHAITWRQAALIGMAQVLAIVPGVSRSGATILGGMIFGLTRQAATSFSFFLAIPLLGGASLVELVTSLDEIEGDSLLLLIVGTVSAAIFAFISVGWLLRFVSRNSFIPFGYYRIVAGIVILIWALSVPAAAQEPAQIPTHEVEISGADGLPLRGTYYAPHAEAPAVLLLHQLYVTQRSWNFLVTPLTEAGFNVLTVDLRGYGKTGGRINWQSARTDTVRWAAWLAEQSGVQSVAMAGSSMGSSLAVDACFAYEPCTRVVAISPALSYYGVSIRAALEGELPVMIAYADRDRYPARDMDDIVALAGEDLTLFTYSGRSHGIDLFRHDETLAASVISYLQGNDVTQPVP